MALLQDLATGAQVQPDLDGLQGLTDGEDSIQALRELALLQAKEQEAQAQVLPAEVGQALGGLANFVRGGALQLPDAPKPAEGAKKLAETVATIADLEIKKTKAMNDRNKKKRPTDVQLKAGGFARTFELASDEFQALENEGFKGTDLTESALRGLGSTFGIARATLSPENKRFLQAAEAMSNAALRPETGAAITKEEMTKKMIELIPLAGDGPEVIAQKKRAQQQVLENLKARAGPDALSLLPRTSLKKAAKQEAKFDPTKKLTEKQKKNLELVRKRWEWLKRTRGR